MPSSRGMFVFKDVTSAVIKKTLDGRDGSFSISFRKCLVSLMCDGTVAARAWMKWVM